MPIGKIGPDRDSYVPLNLGMMIISKATRAILMEFTQSVLL